MKDRINPCIHYICAHETCRKGYKDVTMTKCKNCARYRGRKSNRRSESVRLRREKEKVRTDFR